MALFLTARAYKKSQYIISRLIKLIKRKGYDSPHRLNNRHLCLSIKKIPKQQAIGGISALFTPCSHHHFPTIVAKVVSVLRFDFTSEKPIRI
ncbi:hypothetical protein [Pantoea brenneri]|uniref:hypothetical protein n=1 Tax=Pantoea brenneri TaxID=472694 RepID=UPI00289BE075|nr:hypothetical protein [Pantoea brenneri]